MSGEKMYNNLVRPFITADTEMSFVELVFTNRVNEFFHNKVSIKLLKIISNAEVVTPFYSLI